MPFSTPWRTIQISKDVPGLVNSYLIENLNEPNKLADVSWIKPVKYMGIWWEMHIDKSKWQFEGGKHGATTENAKRYIDFCAENNIPALLIEGWNTGWETWWGEKREETFDFTTPYPDFNLQEVVAYGKTKGVQLIGHHETSSDVGTYNKRMDAGFALYKEVGVSAIKSGYVGSIIPKGEYHYGQFMVNHYNTVMQKTAENKIMLNVHEPIKPTGLCRTYPNLMSGEGMRGQEYNAWSTGNPPGHNVILAYTRNLAGPMDYTPGIFDLTFENSKNKDAEKPFATRVRTTLAHQLGLYVVYYSPLQMAADLPENYAQHPAFQFIKDVGVDWSKSLALAGEIGEYIVMARQEKSTGKWFVGGISGEKEKGVTLNFDFLEDGKTYQAIVYKDHADAHWDTNPKAYEIEKINLKKGDTLTLKMAPAGGFAISLE
jgi:alpha-glucosidase